MHTHTPKFGFSLSLGAAAAAVHRVLARAELELRNSQDLWIGVPRSSSRPPCY